MDAGQAIRTARKEASLSQTALAERVGTSQATISAYEHGRKQPSVRTLSRLLAASGARLSIVTGRPPVLEPSEAALARVSRALGDVIDLAESLPVRHEPEIRFPRLPATGGDGSDTRP